MPTDYGYCKPDRYSIIHLKLVVYTDVHILPMRNAA